MGNMEMEIEYLEKCLNINPKNKYALSNKGAALMERGMFSEAENLFHRAIEVDGAYSWPYYNLACLCAVRGQKELCIAYLRMALELDPALREDAIRDTCLENLRRNGAFRQLLE